MARTKKAQKEAAEVEVAAAEPEEQEAPAEPEQDEVEPVEPEAASEPEVGMTDGEIWQPEVGESVLVEHAGIRHEAVVVGMGLAYEVCVKDGTDETLLVAPDALSQRG